MRGLMWCLPIVSAGVRCRTIIWIWLAALGSTAVLQEVCAEQAASADPGAMAAAGAESGEQQASAADPGVGQLVTPPAFELFHAPIPEDIQRAAAADEGEGQPESTAEAGGDEAEMELAEHAEPLDLRELDPDLEESYNFANQVERERLAVIVGNDPYAFSQACTARRNAEACAYTGIYHLEKHELRKAYRFLAASCELDEPQGCYEAGQLMETGRGTAQNLAGAYAAYAKSCELIEGRSCLAAGLMAEEGRGAARNIRLAFEGFLKACRLEVAAGCTRTGKYFYHGIGVKKNDQLAAMYFGLSCDQADGEACYYLATLHQSGQGLPHDSSKTIDYIIKACEAGEQSGKACNVAADVYQKGLGGREVNIKLSYRFSEKACELGQAASCMQAGIINHEGLGRTINVHKAFAYYVKGCDLQLARSCVLAGMVYDMTHPAPAKGEKKKHGPWEYFGKACQMGSQEGCKFEEEARAQLAKELEEAAQAEPDLIQTVPTRDLRKTPDLGW